MKVVSTKALPQFSGQGCPEDLWVPTRALKQRLDGKTPQHGQERADYSALANFHPVDADVHAAVALQMPVNECPFNSSLCLLGVASDSVALFKT